MSRFTRLEKPLMSPGECMACKGYALPVVDFNVSLQINGRLYLCEECLQEALITINPEAFDSDNKNWEAYAKQLESKIKEIQDGVASTRNSFDALSISSDCIPDGPVEKKPERTDEDSEPAKSGASKGKPANKKRGPNDVSGSSIDELLGID